MRRGQATSQKGKNMEKKHYLIFRDNSDDRAYILGYIFGTEEEADAYCSKLNENATYIWDEFEYKEIDKLN